MKHVVIGIVTVLLSVSMAWAQTDSRASDVLSDQNLHLIPRDHLKCYRAFSTPFLTAGEWSLITQCGREHGCKIRERVALMCLPAIKVIHGEPQVDGRTLPHMACYPVECEGAQVHVAKIRNQFGEGFVAFRDEELLCTPTKFLKLFPPFPAEADELRRDAERG